MVAKTELTRIQAIEKIEEELAKLKENYLKGMTSQVLQGRVKELNDLAKDLKVPFSCDSQYIVASSAPQVEEDGGEEDDDSYDDDDSYGDEEADSG